MVRSGSRKGRVANPMNLSGLSLAISSLTVLARLSPTSTGKMSTLGMERVSICMSNPARSMSSILFPTSLWGGWMVTTRVPCWTRMVLPHSSLSTVTPALAPSLPSCLRNPSG